ncbi:hypothetical protein VN24_21300 [Paenibacillus beijingensis]|uniref:Cobalt transporter n=2 Tax=Paenibacillus beijingensis TaxID=1126833 RepID=A0A0D5NNS6_9BACL|nr:hypothetical protein VN24_21300 [Paenibacillus beijingensis]
MLRSAGTAGASRTEGATRTEGAACAEGTSGAPVAAAGAHSAASKRFEAAGRFEARLFDPRALLAAYMLLAAAVLQQRGWAGAAVASALTAALLWPLRRYLRPYAGAVKAYALLIFIMTALAGIRLQPPGFDTAAASLTLLRLGKLLLVMLLGLPLLGLTTPLRLQQAIEQSLAWTRRLRVPVHSIALTVALVFRFIPLLAAEWHRFARIACARGKTNSRPGSVPPAMLKAVLIPFLLSLLRLADGVADALEARGFGSRDEGAAPGTRLRFTRADAILVMAALVLFICLFLAARSGTL